MPNNSSETKNSPKSPRGLGLSSASHSDKDPRGRKIRITFHGGAGEVTGSNFLIETECGGQPTKILVDCGLSQGSKIAGDKNREPFPYDPSSVDYLFVTHSHIDHIGRIPKLVRDGFKGKIYSTPPTKDIAKAMLVDSLGVLEKEAHEEGKETFYSLEDVSRSMFLWKTEEFHKEIKVCEGISVEFKVAGHTLGSAIVIFNIHGKKIAFTGDLGNSPTPLLHDTEKLLDVDYLVMESVYGDRRHENRDMRKQLLEDIIEETAKKGGTLLIPAFSFERTQELLYEIETMMESSRIPLVPVFVDSPLAIELTEIYANYQDYFKKDALTKEKIGRHLFHFPQLHFTKTREESMEINSRFAKTPKIIMAGSGMSNGGRIIHHEKVYLPDSKNTILFAGFQAANTLGRRIQDGEKKIKILRTEIPVRAKVKIIHGYSAHRDVDGLLEFVSDASEKLKKVFVVMGEPKSSSFLVQRIRDYLGISAVAPEDGESAEIEL